MEKKDLLGKKTVIRRHSKRLPLSTDIEGVLKDDDDLFMPPSEVAPVQEEAPATPKRASRLNRVAEQAPKADDDGVIDVPHREPAPETAGNADDSPI